MSYKSGEKMTFEQEAEKIEKWKQKQGWEMENPFIHLTDPSLFVGFEDLLTKLYQFAALGKNYAVIYGQYGYGKTALIKKAAEEFSKKYNVLLFEDAPKKEYIAQKIKTLCGGSLLRKLKLIKIEDHDYKKINEKIKKRTILIFDEAHALDEQTFSYLRSLSENGTTFSIIFAGKPELIKGEKILPAYLEDRLDLCEGLRPLYTEEGGELIKKRIEILAKSKAYLFSEQGMKEIVRISRMIPREIIENCSKLVEYAIKKDLHSLDENTIKKVLEGIESETKHETEQVTESKTEEIEEEVEEKTSTLERLVEGEAPPYVPKETYNIEKQEFLAELSPLQRRIVMCLYNGEPKTSREIAKDINDKYDTIRHMIKRLQGKYKEPENRPKIKELYPLVLEEPNLKGRGYAYRLAPHVRKILSTD